MREATRLGLCPQRSVTFLAVLLVTLLFVQPALATTPSGGSGTFTFAAAPTQPSRTAGGNTFLTLSGTEAISGAITGAATVDFTQVIHSSGEANSNGLITCTCVIGTSSGTVVFRFEGSGAFTAADPFAGQFTVLSASGGLSGLRGDGTFSAIDGGGTYTFRWHFDP